MGNYIIKLNIFKFILSMVYKKIRKNFKKKRYIKRRKYYRKKIYRRKGRSFSKHVRNIIYKMSETKIVKDGG